MEYNSVSVFRLPRQTEGEIDPAENSHQRDDSYPVLVFVLHGRFAIEFRGRGRGKRPQKILPEREVSENCGVTIKESVLGRYDLSLKWRKTSHPQYLFIFRVVLQSMDESEATDVTSEDESISKTVSVNSDILSLVLHRKSEGTEKVHDENDKSEIPSHTSTSSDLDPNDDESNNYHDTDHDTNHDTDPLR